MDAHIRNLDTELYLRMRQAALRRQLAGEGRMSVGELINEALREWLEKHDSTTARNRENGY